MSSSLPEMKNEMPASVKREYTYSQILDPDVIELPSNLSVVVSKDDLDLDMDGLLELIRRGVTIRCLDYESILFIDGLLEEKVDNRVFLIDDGMRIPREYVDLTKLKNLNVTVPLTYLLWGVKFNEEVNTYCFRYISPLNGDFNYISADGNEKLSLENLKKIRKKLLSLSRHNPKTDLDKVLLVSDFIQSRTQYVCEPEKFSFKAYVLKNKYGLVETVNNERCGFCMGIANYSSMLLDNEEFGTETETVVGSNHAWNKVLIDGKYYYFDNTWNITRSDNRHRDALMTLSFQKKYTLFGTKTADAISYHQHQSLDVYNNGVLSEEDYEGVMKHNSKFFYRRRPAYKSYKKKR